MIRPTTAIFDVGHVLFEWDPRYLFEKLIADPDELDWFLSNVVTKDWHFQADAGRPLATMLEERIAQFPEHEALIQAYAERWNETVPGPVPGSHAIVRALHDCGVPLFAITNFGHEFWAGFRPEQPIFDLFDDVLVSGTEKMMKPGAEIYALAIARFGVDPEAMPVHRRPPGKRPWRRGGGHARPCVPGRGNFAGGAGAGGAVVGQLAKPNPQTRSLEPVERRLSIERTPFRETPFDRLRVFGIW